MKLLRIETVQPREHWQTRCDNCGERNIRCVILYFNDAALLSQCAVCWDRCWDDLDEQVRKLSP